jgi:hypothetical protein
MVARVLAALALAAGLGAWAGAEPARVAPSPADVAMPPLAAPSRTPATVSAPPLALVFRGEDAALARVDPMSLAPTAELPLGRAELRLPGITLDPEAGRVSVAGAEPLVAEVDLATLEITYHELEREGSLLARFLAWLQSDAQAKAASGPVRRAVWLGDRRLAVTGTTPAPWTRTAASALPWTRRPADRRHARLGLPGARSRSGRRSPCGRRPARVRRRVRLRQAESQTPGGRPRTGV